jgi:hypothetical protein
MSATGSVLPNDPVVHAATETYVAPAAQTTYTAPAAHDLYIAPAGSGASEAVVHGVGVRVDSHA